MALPIFHAVSVAKRSLTLLGVAGALAACASTSANAPQQAVVESEAARQTAVTAVVAGDSVDNALEKAATVPLTEPKPKP